MTQGITETEDFHLALRLLHVVRAYRRTPGNMADPARDDPMYPVPNARIEFYDAMDQLLARYPYRDCAPPKD